MAEKYVYYFGSGRADGNAGQKQLLGGKGANLAEMTSLGIPVPPGFTISTEVCTYYYDNDKTYPSDLKAQIKAGIEKIESSLQKKFGDLKSPLLVSVRSGAAVSMPGMMDTVLNLGLTEDSVKGLIELTQNERFAYDSYRRFIQMFGNVVLCMNHHDFENILESLKKAKGVKFDTDLCAKDLKELILKYKTAVKHKSGLDFPESPEEQLDRAIDAVFASWNNSRAITYRKLNSISDDIGTAVNVQSMVYGNMGETSGTGVAFTRNPSNGEKKFFGEFLMNAQGEDVVAGIRTPLSIERLADIMPNAHKELLEISERLEKHYTDMQDLEFTIENGELFLLQTRNAKRTAFAAIRTAVEMVEEGLITKETALKRVDPHTLPSLLAKIFDQGEKNKAIDEGRVLARGLAAGPGAASGVISLSAEKTVEVSKSGNSTILVRVETSPEDIAGMHSSEGILTACGGMTSHAAVVARGMNRPCIVGCGDLEIDYAKKTAYFKNGDNTVELKEGDYISIDGFTGEVINANIKTIPSEIEQVYLEGSLKLEESTLAQQYEKIMSWATEYSKLKVRANADTAVDARTAVKYGATGIGLCRTEHMFFDDERILEMRKMIVASSTEKREAALANLLPFQRNDFKELFKEMQGFAVTIRLLDPPLHEFLPHDDEAITELAKELCEDVKAVTKVIEEQKEFNPMLGHRGCRLGVSYPEITAMQTRAILEAACELKSEGIEVSPEIMVPLVGHYKELENQSNVIRETATKVFEEKGVEVDFLLGTMIEVPRAAVTADEIAEYADFFSFGTNDLTQMGAGFSRDDAHSFLPHYVDLNIYRHNPFQVLDTRGIGRLIKTAIELGKRQKNSLKLGVCGEHGGDPESIAFCDKIGLDYVSCSPYRVPIAILAAAQAAIR